MHPDALYLPPTRSGLAWMLDPENPEVGRVADAALATKPDDTCDPDAFAADLVSLGVLLEERHFGIATELIDGRPTRQLLRDAAERCRREQPATWGEAWGRTVDDIRFALRDRHFQATGAARSGIRADEPTAAFDANEPAVSVAWDGDLCWIRLARLAGSADDIAELQAWAGDAPHHFEAARIVVDLRGNGGGNDGFVVEWAMPGIPAPQILPETAREWRVGERAPNAWNWAAIETSRTGKRAPMWGDLLHEPSPTDALRVEVVGPGPVVPGPHPFRGDMVVLTDAATGSSGESSAWLLKRLFGARVVGGRSRGMIEYGNIAPYLFPRSGLLVTLATKHNDYGLPVELRGFPVDVEVDPREITPAMVAALPTSPDRRA